MQVPPRNFFFVDAVWYCRQVSVVDPPAGARSDLPERIVTVSQLVAYNMSAFRKAAGLSQQELGERLGGWSAASVSAAERSWDSKRIKVFDGDEIAQIADALGVPLIAMFLPPEDHGTAVRYVLSFPGPQDRDLKYLLDMLLTWPDSDSSAMQEFRRRLMAAGLSGRVQLLDPRTQQFLDKIERRADERWDQEAAAPQEAERVAADTLARSTALERRERERHRQAVRSLMQARAQLERSIDDLRAFERDYRTRLQAFVEGQLFGLSKPELRSQMERTIEEVREQAARKPGSRMSAIILREDGMYDVLQFSGASDGDAPLHEDAREPEGGSPP